MVLLFVLLFSHIYATKLIIAKYFTEIVSTLGSKFFVFLIPSSSLSHYERQLQREVNVPSMQKVHVHSSRVSI